MARIRFEIVDGKTVEMVTIATRDGRDESERTIRTVIGNNPLHLELQDCNEQVTDLMILLKAVFKAGQQLPAAQVR
jgi:hypothetical protein